MSQQYSLRWNNHQPNFISMFTTLLNTQTLVDVTLAADGKQLLAHKVVLSACSTYFQSLFVDNPSPHPIVILKDVTYADLRTMVDFMYCGEVNVTEEQLPKVLDTAKLLKIKGLTEMPDSTSLTRSQGTSAEFQGDSMDSQRHSPPASPTTKRKRERGTFRRRRKSSTGSTSLNMVGEENRSDVGAQAVDAITLSSVPQQRRMREYHEVRTIDNAQQTTETENMNVEHNMGMDNTPTGLAQGTESSHADSISRLRRSKHFKRQNRVQPEERELRKQVSEPAAAPTLTVKPAATLQKHESYPQYVTPKPFRRLKITKSDHETSSSLLIRPVTLSKLQSPSGDQPSISDRPASLSERKPSTTDRQTSVSERPGSLTERQGSVSERQPSLSERQPSLTERQPSLSDRQASVSDRQSSTSERQSSTSTTSTSFEYSSASESSQTLRASHTPAVRSGPPLSCNFCWNTVDECGRILRRKTQYHCPECRTNLCIVPCFHEYHEGPVAQSAANVR